MHAVQLHAVQTWQMGSMLVNAILPCPAVQAMGYAELKHHSRHECPDQPRNPYVPPPYDGTPCYLNEKTCSTFYNDTGMGKAINITYDWKHLIYEDYDRWLYNG